MVTRPDIVYHYTSIDTLHKIFTGEKIWATSISYLNDHSEQTYFLEQLRSRLPSYLAANPHIDSSLFDKFEAETRQRPPLSELPFVASFSQDADSLPQWRAYCSAGSGVAIGFRADALEVATVCNGTHRLKIGKEILEIPPQVSFKGINYLPKDNASELDKILQQSVDTAKRDAAEIEKTLEEYESPPHLEDLLWFELQAQAGLTKHISFIDEKEYRLSAKLLWSVARAIRFRPSRSTLIPYVELDIKTPTNFLESRTSLSNRLYGLKAHFIEEIVVGPSASTSLTIEAVESMFRFSGYAVTVRSSSIPFRDWI